MRRRATACGETSLISQPTVPRCDARTMAGQTRGEKASGAGCGASVCVAVLVTVTITVTITVTVTVTVTVIVIVIVTVCEAVRKPSALGGAAEGRARSVEERTKTNRRK